MELKHAITLAQEHVRERFAEEGVADIGLEGADFDDQAQEWHITIGFSHPKDEPRDDSAGPAASRVPPRIFKVVRISDETDQILSVKDREART